MTDLYVRDFNAYHERTFHLDPAPFLAPLLEHLRPPALIMDVGCGSGRDLSWFKNRGFDVLGLERSPGLAALARKNAGCEVIEADFENFDFSTRPVEAVILIGALVHVPHVHFKTVLANILAGLRPGGHALVTVKEGCGRSQSSDGRVFHLWFEKNLADVFRSMSMQILANFKNVSTLDTGEHWLSFLLRLQAPVENRQQMTRKMFS